MTEEIAIAVLDLYPTLLSLARAYSLIVSFYFLDWSFTSASSYLSIYLTLVFSYQEGDVAAQEDMLRKQSRNVVSAVASRNIFQLVWGN